MGNFYLQVLLKMILSITANVISLKFYKINWHVCVLVHEHLSVRDAGIRLMTSLYLCPGPVPTATQVHPYNLGVCECKNTSLIFPSIMKNLFSFQLFLYFSIGLAPSVGQELEIIVEESLTVKEVIFFFLNEILVVI